MTSDNFFLQYEPSKVFGRPIDIAFLDGGHRCEMLLRDFINTEKHCKKNSIIILHDCLPLEEGMATRTQIESTTIDDQHKGFWTGDVWRTALLLKRKRLDLQILAVDAAPTGLVLITNLDPEDRLLRDQYSSDAVEMLRWSLSDGGLEALHAELEVRSTSSLSTGEQIGRFFWL